MEAFAEVRDLEARWRRLDPDERAHAQTLLQDAADFIRVEYSRNEKEPDTEDPVLLSALRMVSCAMVKRIMAPKTDADVTQMSATVGPMSRSYTFANPTRDLYLRDQERKMLGLPLKAAKVAFASPFGRRS